MLPLCKWLGRGIMQNAALRSFHQIVQLSSFVAIKGLSQFQDVLPFEFCHIVSLVAILVVHLFVLSQGELCFVGI